MPDTSTVFRQRPWPLRPAGWLTYKTCEEARTTLGEIVTYETKRSFGRNVALVKAPAVVHAGVAQAVGEALAYTQTAQIYQVSGPYELRLTLASSLMADARYYDGETSIRLDGVTVLYRDANLINLLARAL